ncbi:MAG TPA: hypothetical protein VMF09_00490 [Solirubrobacteraceae bacterium]|nr:hypothetical protein [Solirubrobacteraceae bacterium]
MRSAIAAIFAVAAGLLVANMLGVAAAEAPTTSTATPVRSVSVEGVADQPLAQDANLAASTAAYRQAMADAIGDGQGKAEFLAGKAGATLGSVQSIVEDGGSISCTGSENEESRYVEYEGEQPDFGSGRSVDAVAPVSAPAAAAAPKRAKRRKKKQASAKAAAAVSCTLGAQVSLVYAIE